MENLDLTKILKVGDKVYSDTFGYGIVETVDSIGTYAIHVLFSKIDVQNFSKTGKYYHNDTDTGCSIFPSKENRDWNSVIPTDEKANYFVSLDGIFWALHQYSDSEIEKIKDNKYTAAFKYIVPVAIFNVLAKNFSDNVIYSIINAEVSITLISVSDINSCSILATTESSISEPTEERQSKYKVGDTVKIKSEKWYEDNAFVSGNVYPVGIIGETNYFIPEMSEYCGKTAKITKVVKDNWYMLDFEEDSDFEADYYTWSDWMFENSAEKISTPYVDGFYPVGKELELHDGTVVRVEVDKLCIGCIYREHWVCKHLGKNKCCTSEDREDKESVIFKKIN